MADSRKGIKSEIESQCLSGMVSVTRENLESFVKSLLFIDVK